jgi:hypothetical protein
MIFKLPEFLDNRHVEVVRLPALRTGRLYSLWIYSCYSYLLEDESTPGSVTSRFQFSMESLEFLINPLKTKRICFI